MYIVKATRTTKKNVADAYVKGVNSRVEYLMCVSTDGLWLTAEDLNLITESTNVLSQNQLKKLFNILPKDKTATRRTGGGILLEYTKEV